MIHFIWNLPWRLLQLIANLAMLIPYLLAFIAACMLFVIAGLAAVIKPGGKIKTKCKRVAVLIANEITVRLNAKAKGR
jgi:hypothetical protein